MENNDGFVIYSMVKEVKKTPKYAVLMSSSISETLSPISQYIRFIKSNIFPQKREELGLSQNIV